MKMIIVDDNTFNVGCIFYVNCSADKMKRAVEKRLNQDNLDFGDNDCTGKYFFCKNEKERKYLRGIWLESFDFNNVDIGRLVHEIVHLVHSIIDWLGFENDDELEAYMIEYYVKQFLKKYNTQ